MTIKTCPNCNKKYTVSFDTSDYEHQCNSDNNALDQEDVVITGSWKDFSGSVTVPAQQVTMQGAENKLWGTEAGIEGDDLEDHTRRGLRASTRRQRQHFEFIGGAK